MAVTFGRVSQESVWYWTCACAIKEFYEEGIKAPFGKEIVRESVSSGLERLRGGDLKER